MKSYRADLHIHSCLSPCGDWAMTPRDIVAGSCGKGLDMIALCDHNSAENAGAAMAAGKAAGLYVIPGMEICSREEVHVLGLFETLEQALSMQEMVYSHLPGQNTPELWGDQVVANEKNEVIRENQRLLIGATTLYLDAIVDAVHERKGLCIAAHVDRPAFSIISNLGFIPRDLQFDALEVSCQVPLREAGTRIPGVVPYACITSSDAHFPADIGRVSTAFVLRAPEFGEIRMALQGRNGRRIAA
ncbi:MAG: PHP domain-containing protein [Desulfosalsimonadaceae bacterium]